MPQSVWWIRMISVVPRRRWGDGQRPAFVGGHHSPGVADDVGVALLQAPEQAVDVEPGVHAGQDGDAEGGGAAAGAPWSKVSA